MARKTAGWAGGGGAGRERVRGNEGGVGLGLTVVAIEGMRLSSMTEWQRVLAARVGSAKAGQCEEANLERGDGPWRSVVSTSIGGCRGCSEASSVRL